MFVTAPHTATATEGGQSCCPSGRAAKVRLTEKKGEHMVVASDKPARHEKENVQASAGQLKESIKMKRLLLVGVAGLALALPLHVQAGQSSKGPTTESPALVASSRSACSLCLTCGGEWPVFSGGFQLAPEEATTFERGAHCQGGFRAGGGAKKNTRPQLCCRRQ